MTADTRERRAAEMAPFLVAASAMFAVMYSTQQDRGLASALYFSGCYVAGALGGYVPGLAFERWEWTGVAMLALAAYAIGALAVLGVGAAGRPG